MCCSFFKQQNIRTVFFPVLSFQWDRKNEILNVVSANLFLLLFPSFYPFCFLAWFLFICFSIFCAISYYIYFFSYFFHHTVCCRWVICLLVSDPKVLSNICLLMVRKNDNDHLAGSIERNFGHIHTTKNDIIKLCWLKINTEMVHFIQHRKKYAPVKSLWVKAKKIQWNMNVFWSIENITENKWENENHYSTKWRWRLLKICFFVFLLEKCCNCWFTSQLTLKLGPITKNMCSNQV